MNLELFFGLLWGAISIGVYFPQIIRILRTKHSKDVAGITYVILFFGSLSMVVYGLYKSDPVLYIPNIIDLFLPIYILILKRKYDKAG